MPLHRCPHFAGWSLNLFDAFWQQPAKEGLHPPGGRSSPRPLQEFRPEHVRALSHGQILLLAPGFLIHQRVLRDPAAKILLMSIERFTRQIPASLPRSSANVGAYAHG